MMGMPPPPGMHHGPGGRFYRETDEKPHITKELILRILKNFKAYKGLLAAVVVTVLISSVLGLVTPIITKNIIDVALPQKNISLLLTYIILAFASIIVANLISVLQSYLNTLVSKKIVKDMRSEMYGHMQEMPLGFFTNLPAGEIASRMSNDIGGIEHTLSGVFMQILQSVFVFTSTAVTLFLTSWQMAILSLVILPLFIIPTKKVGKVRWNLASKLQVKLAKLNTIVQECLNAGGILLIKLFTKEKEKQREFDEVNDEIMKLQVRESVVGRWFFMTIQSFTAVGPLLIYLVGGILMIHSTTVSIGVIVMFVNLLSRLYQPITTISNIHVDIIRSMALFERVYQYLDMPVSIKDKDDAVTVESAKGDIEFKNVTFAYNEKTTILKDVSFSVKAGQMVAFVGPSGAGKSTITSLVPRLYDVNEGSVTLDGIDVRDVTQDSLRRQIGMVTQDTYLFNATVKENLLFAKPDATDDEIESACKTANIHDFIMSLPDKYDTMVGDRGVKLSGGEKQRVSIARGLLKDPRIVIFDEATSSLDSNSEFLIQDAIGPLLKNRTSMIIAHRLSTVMEADVIFVVSEGRIVESGTHSELLLKGGLYSELYEKQFKPRSAKK